MSNSNYQQVFSCTYRNYSLVLSQPNQTKLKVFESDGTEFMSILLLVRNDLVKAIAVAKTAIDEQYL